MSQVVLQPLVGKFYCRNCCNKGTIGHNKSPTVALVGSLFPQHALGLGLFSINRDKEIWNNQTNQAKAKPSIAHACCYDSWVAPTTPSPGPM